MEGKYTKVSTVVGILALLITVWQITKESTASFEGQWIMESHIEKADLSTYKGMKYEWVLNIMQNGNILKGSGEKIKSNNKDIDHIERTTLVLNGTIKGNKFNIEYIQDGGGARKTTGLFKGVINDDQFNGLFFQTASNSTGTISGRKVE